MDLPVSRTLPLIATDTSAPPRLLQPRQRLVVLLCVCAVLIVLAAAVFVWPRATVITYIHQDVWAFFDFIHRLQLGHTPHVDFHAPFGALAFALPFLGYRAVGQFAGSLEFANVFMLAIALPIAAILLCRRTTTGVAVIFLIALAGIVAVPRMLGMSGLLVTHACFYNRWGWGLFATLLLAALPLAQTDGSSQPSRLPFLADALCIAGMLMLLFFLKATYFLVGFAFVGCFGVVLARFPRAAVLGLALFALALLVVSLATGITDDYVLDLWRVVETSRNSDAHQLPTPSVASVLDYSLVYIALAVLSVGVAALQRRITLKQTLYFAFVVVACVVLAWQNSEFPFLFALINVFVAAAGLCPLGSAHRRLVVLALCLFFSPTVSRNLVAIASFHIVATGDFKMFAADLPRLDNAWFGNRAVNWFAANDHQDAVATFLWARRHRAPKHADLSAGEHLATLRSGVELLRHHGVTDEPVETLDYINCFPTLLNAAAPKGVLIYKHLGRHIDQTIVKDRELVFGDAVYLMIPVFPLMQDSAATLLDAHREYLREAWKVVAKNEHWQLLAKLPATSESRPARQ